MPCRPYSHLYTAPVQAFVAYSYLSLRLFLSAPPSFGHRFHCPSRRLVFFPKSQLYTVLAFPYYCVRRFACFPAYPCLYCRSFAAVLFPASIFLQLRLYLPPFAAFFLIPYRRHVDCHRFRSISVVRYYAVLAQLLRARLPFLLQLHQLCVFLRAQLLYIPPLWYIVDWPFFSRLSAVYTHSRSLLQRLALCHPKVQRHHHCYAYRQHPNRPVHLFSPFLFPFLLPLSSCLIPLQSCLRCHPFYPTFPLFPILHFFFFYSFLCVSLPILHLSIGRFSRCRFIYRPATEGLCNRALLQQRQGLCPAGSALPQILGAIGIRANRATYLILVTKCWLLTFYR